MATDELRLDRDGVEGVPSVGRIGHLCNAVSTEFEYRKTNFGPWYKCVCNRWLFHDGPHVMTDGKDFCKLGQWGEGETEPHGWKEDYRRRMVAAEVVG